MSEQYGLYSLKDVARIFDLQEARLRYWAQTGFVSPSVRHRGRSLYTFPDLVSIRVAKELLDGGLPFQRVRKNLEALRELLPQGDRPLASLRVCSDGERVVVLDDQAAFEATTGQLLFSFAISALDQKVAEVLSIAPEATRQEPEPEPPSTAYAAFTQGLEADDRGEVAQAETHYRRATELDPGLAAAWTNLGNLLDRAGRRGDAREVYERALSLDPEQPEARYNLANLLSDLGETERAMAEYRRVTGSCPEFADAHFNLALLYARAGDGQRARVHLGRYLDLDAEGAWAARARELLASLEV